MNDNQKLVAIKDNIKTDQLSLYELMQESGVFLHPKLFRLVLFELIITI